MPRKQGEASGKTTRLDREQILDVAMRIVDREGMSALSMRRLGAELSVDPMAIYYHLPDKQAIISGLVQRVFEDIAGSAAHDDTATWQDRVRHWALTYHRHARAHANLIVYLVSDAGSATDSVMQANEELYAALSGSGLPEQDLVHAADMIVDYIHGAILGETAPAPDDAGWRGAFADHIDSAPHRYPSLRRVFSALEPSQVEIDVEFALDVVIAGLEQRGTQR